MAATVIPSYNIDEEVKPEKRQGRAVEDIEDE